MRRVCARLSGLLAGSPRVEGVPLAPAADDAPRHWRHRELPRLERELELDGLVSFTSGFPLFGRGLRLQLIHELPWCHGERENAGRAHKLWARHGWRRAARIVVPSERVHADLTGLAPHAGARAHVIPWGVDDAFRQEVVGREPLEALGLSSRPYFLMAGATRPKKQARLAILALLAVPEAALVITGPLHASITEDLALARQVGLEGRVHVLGEVDEDVLVALTHHASGALSLARSEGFGLGTLEALAAGTPVVVRPASAPAELAGEHALFAEDEESLAGVLRELVEAPPSASERAARRAQVAHLTWERAAARYADLLLELTA